MKRNHQEMSIEIKKVSDYKEKNIGLFFKIVLKTFDVTSDNSRNYPNYYFWYIRNIVPGIFKGTRDIFVAYVNNNFAGITILKREKQEKKLCTIFVLEEYRKMGVATLLIEESFKYLETTKPLLSIPDYEVNQFLSIIDKYDWKQTQILDQGYYRKASQEIVFNGKIL